MITKKILPTLPLFENVVSQLEGTKFFSGLDLTSMFYQLRIREEDIEKTPFRIQQIAANVSSLEFTFTFRVTIIISVFVLGRSRAVQKLKKWVCTTRDRPGTKTEIIMVTLNVKVNPEEDTLTAICCTSFQTQLNTINVCVIL